MVEPRLVEVQPVEPRPVQAGASGIAGVVLTGGSSRRMGMDKALIQIDGRAMVDRVGDALRAAGCSTVVAIGPSRLAGGLQPVDDLYPGQGPLGGILTAMATLSSGAELVFVLACDLPSIDGGTIQELARAAREATETGGVDVIMARTDRLEPLCAIWNPRCAPALQAAFDSGERAIHSALNELTVIFVEVPPETLRNVNTPDDLPTL